MPHHPIAIQGLDHIVLRIRDRDRMVAFYTETLGCSVDRDRPDLGLTHIRAGHALIDLITLDGPLGRAGGEGPGREGRNLDHLCLQVTAFDEAAIRAHFGRHGIEVVESGERYGAQGDGPSLYIHDPEGNAIELKGVVGV
jgi:catechol 2,3-dioxygenase-like lactoylglutathione lyase family enzyme